MTEEILHVHTEDVDYNYPLITHLRKWIGACFSSEEKVPGTINIIFCSDEYLLNYNQQYLGHDYYTDIITFQHELDPVEGDLYISLDRVKDNATTRKIALQDEVDRVIIHGVLHLIGYADKTDKDRLEMTQKEDHYLALRTSKTTA